MPASRGDWEYGPDDPDWAGFEGFIRTRDEIDRMDGALWRRLKVSWCSVASGSREESASGRDRQESRDGLGRASR